MPTKIKIGDRWVGDGEPTFIIAEAGSNHNRDLNQAKELIDVAASSGADAVKFQIFRAEALVTRANPGFDVLKPIELPREWIGELAEHAAERGIIFSASPFDREAVDLLCEVGAPFLKWASPEIHDIPLLKYAASKGKPLIISTGMCNLVDIHHAVAAARSEGNDELALLHCVSAYPTEPKNANLAMMHSIRHAFELPVGFSDHTMDTLVPAFAVAMGACILEKHITLSRQLEGPDHFFALEPHDLKEMVRAIREVEDSRGSSIKEPVPDVEPLVFKYKYLVASVDIPKGTSITSEMLTVKRGPYGILPVLLDVVEGRTALRDIKEDEFIVWDAI